MAVSREMRIPGPRTNFDGRPRLARRVVAVCLRGGGWKLQHRLRRREVAEGEEMVVNLEVVVVLDILVEKFPPPSFDDVPHLGSATPPPPSPRVTTSGRRIETRIAILGSLFFRISLSSPRHRGESFSRRVRLKRVKWETD